MANFFLISPERAALIESAITQTAKEFEQAASTQNIHLSKAQKQLQAFKMSTSLDQAQGRAQLMFERMVKLAEKNIIEDERKALGHNKAMLAESYAEEVYHTPGSILTSEEVAKLYQYSDCSNFEDNYNLKCTLEDKIWRRSDGTCNNLHRPLFGAAGTKMSRLLPAEYEDGISTPRGLLQMKGSLMNAGPFDPPNPSPRVISLEVIRDLVYNDPYNTLMVMQWGQFLDHDLDAMPEYGDSFCPHTCEISSSEVCTPFQIIDGDLPDSRLADFCHGFRRSLPACNYPNNNCSISPREQFNTITHFIDGSNVYHHNDTILEMYLLGNMGKLLVTDTNLPPGIAILL